MKYSFVYTSPPEPFVTLDDAKADLIVQHNLDDRRIDQLILGASATIERRTGMTFAARNARFQWEAFPCDAGPLELFHGPLLSATAFGTTDGTTFTALVSGTDYGLWADHHPPLVCAGATGWPTLGAGSRVQLTARLGCGELYAGVPPDIRDACLLIVGHRYYQRGDAAKVNDDSNIPPAARGILDLNWSGRYA